MTQTCPKTAGRTLSAGLGTPPLYLSLSLNLDFGSSVSYCSLRTGTSRQRREMSRGFPKQVMVSRLLASESDPWRPLNAPLGLLEHLGFDSLSLSKILAEPEVVEIVAQRQAHTQRIAAANRSAVEAMSFGA